MCPEWLVRSDTGISGTDRITSDRTLILFGTAEPGSTVHLERSGAGAIGSTTTDPAGQWSFDYTGTTLDPGSYLFTATSTDPAGHTAPSTTITVIVDISGPPAPAITSISADTGASATDRITSDPTLILSGTAEPGNLVTLDRTARNTRCGLSDSGH